MNCIICNNNNVDIFYENYTGYVENSNYNILRCSKCKSHFIDTTKIDLDIYNKIYNNTKTPGYNRYYEYAQKIISTKNPLKFLAYQEETYYPVYKILNTLSLSKKNKILEIGCGYGYTTYAIHKNGYQVLGIDISKSAIDFAKKNFGDFYLQSKIEDFTNDNKFNFIIATELFEHLVEPVGFIKKLKNLLTDDGKILITTPNKDYADNVNKNSIWQTDLPPVHTFWVTRKGIELLANLENMNVDFFDYQSYSEPNRNHLIDFRKINREKIPNSHLDSNYHIKKSKEQNYNPITHFIKSKILEKKPIRNLSSWYLKNIIGYTENRTLSFILSKK